MSSSPLSKLFQLLELLDQANNNLRDSWSVYGEMTPLAREVVQELRSSRSSSLPVLPEDLQALRDFVSWDNPEGMQGSDVEGAILDLLEYLVVPKLLPAGSSVRVRVSTQGLVLPLSERGEAAPNVGDQGKVGMVQLASLECGTGDLPWAVCYSVVFSNPEGGQFVRDLYDYEIFGVE